jgi:hypothetical protein
MRIEIILNAHVLYTAYLILYSIGYRMLLFNLRVYTVIDVLSQDIQWLRRLVPLHALQRLQRLCQVERFQITTLDMKLKNI